MAEQIDAQALNMVTTTVASAADARRLAQAIVQARLAACVQVEVITSHYHWQGALQEGQEWRLVCKTLPRATGALLALLESLHPYTVPQLVVQTLQATPAYVRWVDGEVTTGDGVAHAAGGG
ncbi:cytochrome C biogenesis protein [Acidovorax carolinensis]|uniref:Cytochrome C biogenesis protein n=1 Tax=Acidovorax carolinensis TaxID=553814 RepID=A0A240UAX8_9BURK|nr:divalent-cation tolerance protein CutA [Acidovorax carolinensis]ART55891.1 cytochrome C biogenesis protein [Acidovorax carolinensis]ART58212.1 cytochrome C biogenesis protein [Acidovorax carolinensis]